MQCEINDDETRNNGVQGIKKAFVYCLNEKFKRFGE